ncbi:flagellar protein FliS [Alphaproteobacteria bacterium]|nr:flagellar protein FliS [Alphaproteobacteria bacterium]
MNNNFNVLSYKKVQETINSSKSQYEIVKYLMENLLKSMKSLIPTSNDTKKNKKEEALIRSNHASKSLTIIYSLQVSLDFEKAPKIAQNLFQVYEYCRVQIINILLNKAEQGLKKAIEALEDILDAWKSLKSTS